MKVEITFRDLSNCESVRNYFWRTQSQQTLEELIERSVKDREDTLNALDEQLGEYNMFDVEESFYQDSVEELAEQFNIELKVVGGE